MLKLKKSKITWSMKLSFNGTIRLLIFLRHWWEAVFLTSDVDLILFKREKKANSLEEPPESRCLIDHWSTMNQSMSCTNPIKRRSICEKRCWCRSIDDGLFSTNESVNRVHHFTEKWHLIHEQNHFEHARENNLTNSSWFHPTMKLSAMI